MNRERVLTLAVVTGNYQALLSKVDSIVPHSGTIAYFGLLTVWRTRRMACTDQMKK